MYTGEDMAVHQICWELLLCRYESSQRICVLVVESETKAEQRARARQISSNEDALPHTKTCGACIHRSDNI